MTGHDSSTNELDYMRVEVYNFESNVAMCPTDSAATSL